MKRDPGRDNDDSVEDNLDSQIADVGQHKGSSKRPLHTVVKLSGGRSCNSAWQGEPNGGSMGIGICTNEAIQLALHVGRCTRKISLLELLPARARGYQAS